MSLDFGFKIEGLNETITLLKKLPVEMENKVVSSAARKAANVVRDEIIASAPVGTEDTIRTRTTKKGKEVTADYGRLRDNIKVTLQQGLKTGGRNPSLAARFQGSTGAVVFAIHTGKAYWAQFLEFGTSKMSKRPFFRSAVDRSQDRAVKVLGDELLKGLERVAKSLSSGFKRF